MLLQHSTAVGKEKFAGEQRGERSSGSTLMMESN